MKSTDFAGFQTSKVSDHCLFKSRMKGCLDFLADENGLDGVDLFGTQISVLSQWLVFLLEVVEGCLRDRVASELCCQSVTGLTSGSCA